MASTPITLAAIATSAVSGLEVTGYRVLRTDEAVEHSVILESSEGDLLVQLPESEGAEVHHSAKILGQSALTVGVREQLPFIAPKVLGMVRHGDTRAIVSTYLHGSHFDVEDLEDDALLLESIASTLASIHLLPVSVVVQQGLRVRTPNDARLDAQSIIERAYRSGLVPEVVHHHWKTQFQDLQLWDFQPEVTHGSLSDTHLLVEDDLIIGVLDWSELSVGDPAIDFAWLAAGESNILAHVAQIYADSNPNNSIQGIITRAKFWHELEIAEWLLHGLEHRDQQIIDDAVSLFDQLVSHLQQTPHQAQQPSNLGSAEAASRPESVPDHYSDTARFDMLDEDRHFAEDRDFAEHDPADLSDATSTYVAPLADMSAAEGSSLDDDAQATSRIDIEGEEPTTR